LTVKPQNVMMCEEKPFLRKIIVDNNPENSPEKGSVNLPLAMSSQQTKVFELLKGFSTDKKQFHRWYEGAINILNSQFPDKIAQAAHSSPAFIPFIESDN
jgi:hypothetical protein